MNCNLKNEESLTK